MFEARIPDRYRSAEAGRSTRAVQNSGHRLASAQSVHAVYYGGALSALAPWNFSTSQYLRQSLSYCCWGTLFWFYFHLSSLPSLNSYSCIMKFYVKFTIAVFLEKRAAGGGHRLCPKSGEKHKIVARDLQHPEQIENRGLLRLSRCRAQGQSFAIFWCHWYAGVLHRMSWGCSVRLRDRQRFW